MSSKNVKIKKRKDIYDKFKQSLKKISKVDLLVGVPQEETQREAGSKSITNAELMFIHTNGSPAKNIPPRPTIEPTINENKARITKMFSEGVKNALSKDGSTKDIEKLGIWLTNKIKAKFGSDELAPNSPATIAKKKSDRPLIDTGQLRNSITYVIRNK